MKIYEIERDAEDGVRLYVQVVNYITGQEEGPLLEITPEASLKVCYRSLAGLGFAHASSGSAQLALAILLDAFAPNQEAALDNYQDFKADFVAKAYIKSTGFKVTERQILDWLSAKSGVRVDREAP